MSTTPYTGKLTPNQQDQLIDLLWDSLRNDKSEGKHTGWGTKTTTGLLACIERIIYEEAN